MANSKAGTSGEGNAGAGKRPAAAKKSAGKADGGAGQAAKSGGTAGARNQAASSRGSAATTRSDSTNAAESQPAKKTAGAAKSPAKGATKGAAKGAAKSPAKGGAKSAAKTSRGAGKPDLREDLRQFVSENPEGWGHEQWQGLLGRLGERGHDTSNPDQIGMQLERERLHSRLQGMEGVSAQRARSIADRFGTMYSLRHADVDEIVRETKVSRDVAERIKGQL